MDEMKSVVFHLDHEKYGINIERVLGIEREQQIVRVPNTVNYIRGIMNLRGEVIPVYALRRKFNLPDSQKDTSEFMIVRIRNTKIALEVDRVKEIYKISSENLLQMPVICVNDDTRYFKYVIRHGTDLIVILDVDALFSEEELERIDQMVNQIEI